MTVLATATALIASRYFTLDPATFLPQQRAVYLAHLAPLLLHISGGVLALSLGPWQFSNRLRTRYPVVHRAIGRVYLVGVLAAGTGGLLLAPKDWSARSRPWASPHSRSCSWAPPRRRTSPSGGGRSSATRSG
ncbi:DUF2306 domain-containing protein [Streptacidiphilus sp. 4-A2]|nr:DUF2306 domain-containing protein [Streptacidiphilus sp. 4-A2]